MIVNEPAVVPQLTELADRYETALMTNDLAVLDATLWQSPQVVRLGIAENLYGIDSIASLSCRSARGIRRSGR